MYLIPASSLQLIWTSTAQSGVLRAPSAGCWFSLPHLISNWSNFLCTELYNCSTSTFFLWASQIALNSTRPRSRLYPDIPRPDAPVIYTCVFPILTAWPGRRSICNSWLIQDLSGIKWSVCISKLWRILVCACTIWLGSDFNLLHNSQWITFPTQSYLVLHFFRATWLH